MRLQAYKLGTPQKNTLIQKIHFGNQNLKAVGQRSKLSENIWCPVVHERSVRIQRLRHRHSGNLKVLLTNWRTDGPTNQLTGVGARDAYECKKANFVVRKYPFTFPFYDCSIKAHDLYQSLSVFHWIHSGLAMSLIGKDCWYHRVVKTKSVSLDEKNTFLLQTRGFEKGYNLVQNHKISCFLWRPYWCIDFDDMD